MSATVPIATGSWLLPASELGCLFVSLQEQGFQVVGPTLRDEAIV